VTNYDLLTQADWTLFMDTLHIATVAVNKLDFIESFPRPGWREPPV
jgi:hypothetical protein